MYAERCVGLRLENINLFASNCFGFIEEECDESTYLHCRIDRRPAETDVISRGGFPDPLAQCRCLSQYRRGQRALVHRLPGAIHGRRCDQYSWQLPHGHNSARQPPAILANGKPPQAGEPVELFSYEGRRLPDAAVTKIEPDGKINASEREFLHRQGMDYGLRTR